MMKTSDQKYLGDIMSSFGTNNSNIKERCNIGHGAISQIKSMMTEISLGRFCIQIGLILRDSIFVSKILLNSEVWHCLTKYQVEELEKVDRILLRHTLNAHSKTPIEWLYADTGKLDIKSLIQIRRLMYLWHILSRDEGELIHRIYQTQRLSNNVGDWVKMIESDKRELNIDMTDKDIQGVSKETFKSLVKKKVKAKFIQNINSLKAKHSKSKYLECDDLKAAPYIEDSRLNTKNKQLLFKLRSRTLDVKKNFCGTNENPMCTSCGLSEETQGHLLQCPPLVKNLKYLRGKTSKLDENHIYGDIEQQIQIVNIYSDILEEREKLKHQFRDNIPQSEGPVHPSHSVGVLQHTSCDNSVLVCNG